MKRLFFFLLLLGIVVFIHPIVAIFIGVILGISNKYSFYELIFVGVIIDVMYQTIYVGSWFQLPIYSLISVMLFMSLSSIKSHLSFHA